LPTAVATQVLTSEGQGQWCNFENTALGRYKYFGMGSTSQLF